MMVTFSSFRRDIFTLVFPDGMAETRVPLFRNFVVNALIQLQTFVESYQLVNVSFFDKDQSFDDCGLSVVQGCRGQITAVYAFKPSCRCARAFYTPASLEKLSCLYDQCRCGSCGCGVCGNAPCTCQVNLFSDCRQYIQDPAYCGYNVSGNIGCRPPYLSAEPEDDCRFLDADRKFAIGPSNKIWLWPRFPCGYVLAVHYKAIRRNYLDNDYVFDDEDLKDAVACYVESEVARRVDKDQALADKLLANYRLKVGDIIFREESDLKPRAGRVCVEGLDLAELVQLYPDNPYPTPVGEGCAPVSSTSFFNSEQQATASCPPGETGEDVTVTIPAGAYSSTVSQEAANALALAAAQAQAEAALNCDPVPSFCNGKPTSIGAMTWTAETNPSGQTQITNGDGTFDFDTLANGATGGNDIQGEICNVGEAYQFTVTIQASGSGNGPGFGTIIVNLFMDTGSGLAFIQGGSIGPGAAPPAANAWSASGTIVLTGTLPANQVSTIYLDIGCARLGSQMSGTIEVRPLTPP